MVLSTRRGSAALLCPGLSGPHGLGPRARTQAFLGSAPPRHSPAASTAAPPPAAALRSAAGGDPLLDTARGPAPGAGSPGQRAAAGRRLTRQAVAAALRALRNARRGPGARRRSAGLALGGGGSGASVQGSAGGAAPPPARPPSPSPRSRSRSRSRPGAHFAGLPLGSARGSRAGAGGPGVAGEPGTPRSSARAARGADRDAAASQRRLYSPRLKRGPGLGRRPRPRGRPLPHSSPPGLRRRASSNPAA